MSKLKVALTTLTVLLSLSRACNYVGDAIIISQDTGEEVGNYRSPTPVGVCRSERNDTRGRLQSYMFVCAPWDSPYHFLYDTEDCTGTPTNISSVISGDYQCNSNADCNVFKVKTSPIPEGSSCAPSSTIYNEFVSLADQCWVEIDDRGNASYNSYFATCDSTSGDFTYTQYSGIACDGDALMSIAGSSGECTLVPQDNEGELGQSYIDLLECGTVDGPVTTATCSKIVGGTYVREQFHIDHYHYRNETIEAPMGYDVCVSGYEDGLYHSELVYCSQVLNAAFVATWDNRSEATQCDTEPDGVQQIDTSTAAVFDCNEAAGACPHMFFRTSDFEDVNGSRGCKFGESWKEMRVLTDECFSMGDHNAGIADCFTNPASLSLTLFNNSADCASATNPTNVPFTNNECYDFEEQFGTAYNDTAGNWSYFQALECKGTLINDHDIAPDCNFVENPRWFAQNGSDRNHRNRDNERGENAFTLPIGICSSRRMGDNDAETESNMFLCTPWDSIAVVVWDDIDCSGDILYITDVMSTDHRCGAGYCDMVQVQINAVRSVDAADCYDNITFYDEKHFVAGCTNGEVDGGSYGSIQITCDPATDEFTFSQYDAPGCAIDAVWSVTVGDAECAVIGDGPLYLEMLGCGTPTAPTANLCSYVVNPYFEDSNHTRDGAFPLTSEICTVSFDRGRSSADMFFCDVASQLAFHATWNNSRSCNGEPSEVERIWSDDMVCSSDSASKCAYVVVSTSDLNLAADCEPDERIEQSARMINMCWPALEGDGVGSWQVDCNGDTAEVFVYDSVDCSGEAAITIEIVENGCSEGLGDGKMWFQVHECTEPAEPTPEPTAPPTVCDFGEGDWGWVGGACNFCVCEGNQPTCGVIIDSLPSEIEDGFMAFCDGLNCAFDAVKVKEVGFNCDCGSFECLAAGSGNMLKVFVSFVLVSALTVW